ncbi:BTB/POZ protein [Rhizophagus clarus]|uniref:BTB/POZ protein n=1 Tax=Rhizophagus clarus TaxID=94130 RepID=A0A8H3KZ33_9GLOM|nr:BTB/POZ protein [Rhizophagus clarus]
MRYPDIIKILDSANKLSLQELVTYIQFYLIENETNWFKQNFNLTYQTSFENDSFMELQNYCTDLISNKPNKIFNSLKFSSIPEKLLVTIFQSDNLQMSEIQIWEHVLK